MDEARSFGQMAPATMDTSLTTTKKGTDASSMEMATSISDTGLTIGQMARASTLTLMVRTMMAIGSMISTTALARKSGRTVQSLKVTTVMARSMDMGSLFGRIGAPLRVTSSRTKWKGTESTSGLTDESTTVSGRITNSMVRGTLRGKMDG